MRWVIAVPVDSKIKTVKDLDGKRIATELVGFTKRYLKSRGVRAEVDFSWGATDGEGSPPCRCYRGAYLYWHFFKGE